MNFLIKIFEICIVAIFKKIFDKFEFSSKFSRFLIKIISWIFSVCVISSIATIFLLLAFNTYKGISYNSAETEVARKMKSMIKECFNEYSPNVKESTPNFMSWSRIQKQNGLYFLGFKEVYGDIEGNGVVTDILRMRLNPSIYNTVHPLDNITVKLFELLPEFTPIGILTNNIENIKKTNLINIIIPVSVANNIEKKLNIKTHDYNSDFKYFEYNPEFFTKTIIPNLGLKQNTGYRDTRLAVIWIIITKNNSNIIYTFSWSFTNQDKCKFPNGSIAKTQAIIDIAQYAKYEAREKLFNLI